MLTNRLVKLSELRLTPPRTTVRKHKHPSNRQQLDFRFDERISAPRVESKKLDKLTTKGIDL